MLTANRGFTLIEILLALTIVSVVSIVSLNIMTQSYKVWINEDSCLANSQKGEIALYSIINQLCYGRDININTDGNEIEFRSYYHGDIKWLKYGLYLSDGVKALGLKTADYNGNSIDYSNYMPLINNVEELKFIDINGDSSILKIELTIKNIQGNEQQFINYIVPVDEL